MEFLPTDTLAPYVDSLLSPGVLAFVTVMTLVLVSGLGALAIERGETVGRGIRRQLGRSLERWALPNARRRSISLVRRVRVQGHS